MITGIDMTSASGTIQETKLIEMRKLLSKATYIKSSGNISNPFDTKIGSPQGDG